MSGHVIMKSPLSLGVQVMSLVASEVVREISQMDIRGLVPFDHLATEKEKRAGVLEEMQLEDVVQGKGTAGPVVCS